MEETLQASLNSGEEILWRGHAESFETLDKTNKPDFARKCLIGGVIGGGISAVLIASGGISTKTVLLSLVVLLLSLISAINVLSDASKLRKIEYIATTERLIVLRDSVRSAYYSQILTAAFKQDEDGHYSLLCGKDAMKAKTRKYREICVVGAGTQEAGAEIDRFCFYAPADRDGLQKVLHEKLPSLF